MVTDENYTVYDDRFAGASKQLNSVEAFDIDGSFRSLDFDNMRSLFKESFTKLLQEIAVCVKNKEELVDIDTLRHKVSAQIKGIHFRVISDTKNMKSNMKQTVHYGQSVSISHDDLFPFPS